MFRDGLVELLPDDKEAIEELAWAKYKTIKSSGEFQVEAKDDIKKRYGRSPDHADALLNGLWAYPMAKIHGGRKDKYHVEGKFIRSSGVAVLG
jgi:hypothetical protein